MNYRQAIEYLYGLQMFGARPGLEVPRRLAALAGNPQEKLRFIHVAGTNGKGSTCAMLESIYRAAGRRVGLFTSPHLVSFAERIQVNREPISETEVVRLVEALHPFLAEFPADSHPTFFEVVTVMALRYFAGQRCDLIVWEAGLGGRLDATNIVTPLASVITTIDFDHQQWLGDSLDQIAEEKAGIIKPGVPVITAAEPGRGLEVIAETARRVDAPLTVVTARRRRRARRSHRPALARRAPAIERGGCSGDGKGADTEDPRQRLAIRDGLSRVWWPGRLQVLKTAAGRTLVLDGAHNAAASGAAPGPGHRISRPASRAHPGCSRTKTDGDRGHARSFGAADSARAVNSQRTLAPEQLLGACQAANPSALVQCFASLKSALAATSSEVFVVVTGSLYLVGEAMELLQLTSRPAQDERALNEWGGSPPATR
jgi:dihydrofolate synthase/folylpolyglutamate synthase